MFIQPNGQPQYQTTYYTTFFTTNNSFFFLFQSSYSMTSFAVHSMNAFINVSDVAKAIHRTLRPQTFCALTFLAPREIL